MWLRRPQRSPSDFGYQNLSGYADDPAVQAAMAKNDQAFAAYNAAKKSDARKQFLHGGISAVAAPLGASVLSGLFTGGAGVAAGGGGASLPAAATEGVEFSAAGPATSLGKFATLGKLFNSKGAELGVNAGLSLLGMRSSNKAADQARADALAAQKESIALERERLEAELRNQNLDREDAKALNAAINELKKRELDAAEEERAYRRTKDEQQETRLQPYRNVSKQALDRLSAMWGL